jgi:hypothetical protein
MILVKLKLADKIINYTQKYTYCLRVKTIMKLRIPASSFGPAGLELDPKSATETCIYRYTTYPHSIIPTILCKQEQQVFVSFGHRISRNRSIVPSTFFNRTAAPLQAFDYKTAGIYHTAPVYLPGTNKNNLHIFTPAGTKIPLMCPPAK